MPPVAGVQALASALDAALMQARDGRGLVLRTTQPAVAEAALDALDVPDLLRIDVDDSPRSGAIAFGAFGSALATHATDLVLPRMSAHAPSRALRWLTALVDEHLEALTRAAPVLVVIRVAERLDECTERWLDDVDARTRSGVVLLVVGVSEREVAHSHEEVLTRLSGDRLVLARLLAVSYLALGVEDLDGLSGIGRPGVDEALRGLGELVDVAERGRVVVLRCGDCRERLVLGIPGSLLLGVRRELIALMAPRALPAPLLADMALDAGRRPGAQVTELLVDAMSAVAALDAEAAVEYGLAAVAQLEDTSELLTQVAWQLLPLLWRTARPLQARELASRVFTERGQAEAEAQVLLWLGRFEPSPRQALQLTAAALALGDVSVGTRAKLLSVHLRCLSTLGRVEEVRAQLPGALDLAVQADDPDALSRLRTCAGIRAFYAGDFNTARELTAHSERDWQRSSATFENRVPELVWSPHLTAVLGDPLLALSQLDAMIGTLPSGRDSLAAPLLHAERSQVLLLLGRLQEARDEVILAGTRWRRVWEAEAGLEDRLASMLLAVRLTVAVHSGDSVDIDDLESILDRAVLPDGSEAARRSDWFRFMIDEVKGATGSSRTLDPATLRPVALLDPSDEVLAARALLMQGQRWPVELMTSRASARAARDGGHLFASTIDAHLRGLFYWRRDLLETALSGWVELGRPILASHARSDLGSKLLETGDPAGLDLMTRAHADLVQMGAHRDAWRIRWSLRLRGHTLDDQPGPHLTPMEQRVVYQAVLTGATVGGLAEALSVSPHTISTHLRHVYLKLGITSRAELSAWAAEV